MAALGCAALGCSSSTDAPPAEPPGVAASYGPAASTPLSPYPSDRYTIADAATATGRRVHIVKGGTTDLVVGAGLEATVSELDQHDGFSTAGGVIVQFTGPVAWQTIAPSPDPELPDVAVRDAGAFAAPGSPLVLLDVDPTSPERGKARGLVVRYWQQPHDGFYLHDEFTFVAQPAEPLRPRTRYLFAVTDALGAADGGHVHPSPEMVALLAGGSDPYAQEIAGGLAELAKFGVTREHVALATVFTTMSVPDVMLAAAAQVRAIGAPKVLQDWSIERPVTAPDKRARLRAVYQAPEFRSAMKDPPDCAKMPCLTAERFVLDAKGAPVVQAQAGLEVFLAVSDAASTQRRPVVIFQHGLGGDKDGCWGMAERLAPLNAAVFAIDSPHHGSRADDPKMPNMASAIFEFFGISIGNKSFIIGKARDNFRQMSADQLGLVELIASLKDADLFPPGAPDGKPDFDTSRILYIGHSFGSVQGPTLFALAPEVTAAVWNVGGDVLTTLLRDSNTFSLLVAALRPAGVSNGEVARFFAVIQAIVDPGDPINFARYGTVEGLPGVAGWRARDVLLQEVIDDGIVPNSTSDALARAAHLTLVDAIRPISGLPSAPAPLSQNLASGATAGISQFDFIEGGKKAEHGELLFSPEGIAQQVAFFQSALAKPHAVIPAGYPNGPEKPAK